jgi:hypothetical protein
MPELPIRPEALEKAEKAFTYEPADPDTKLFFSAGMRAAIVAFCEAEGLTVERDEHKQTGRKSELREDTERPDAEALARRFHETYERLAPEYGYRTREASAVPWDDVPEANKGLMIAVCGELLDAVRDTERPVLPPTPIAAPAPSPLPHVGPSGLHDTKHALGKSLDLMEAARPVILEQSGGVGSPCSCEICSALGEIDALLRKYGRLTEGDSQ